MEIPRSSVVYRDTQCNYSYTTRELNSASCPPFLVMVKINMTKINEHCHFCFVEVLRRYLILREDCGPVFLNVVHVLPQFYILVHTVGRIELIHWSFLFSVNPVTISINMNA